MPELLDSAGLEIETDYALPIHSAKVPKTIQKWFDTTHDASIESDVYLLHNLEMLTPFEGLARKMFRSSVVTVGTEFVSHILDITKKDELLDILGNLTGYLSSIGEPAQSQRAGIHVHICFTSPNLAMLKNTIYLWRHLEDVFFLLGGMGYRFRGETNDAAYCRPLTKNGPIAVPVNSGHYAKCLDLDDLLESKSTSEFWHRWGDLPNQMPRGRYFPVRYHAFNLSPAWSGPGGKGTIEFRIFNKSLNPLYIYAVTMFCRAFSELCLTSVPKEWKEVEHSVYDKRPKKEIIATLLEVVDQTPLEGDVIDTLIKIMQATPDVSLNEAVVVSHLRNLHHHWEGVGIYDYKLVPERLLKRPDFIDVHVLRDRR